MPGSIWVTDKIHAKITEKAEALDLTQEGLAGVLLLLSVSNETILNQAIDLMKTYDLGGSTDMESKGW